MHRRILAAAVLAVGCSPQAEPGRLDPAVGAALATITAGDVHDRIAFLASDELRGRDTPSPGLETAARWIADQLASFGVQPAGEDGWFQRYPYPLVGLDARESRFEISAGATHALEYGTEFLAWGGRAPTRAVGVTYLGPGLRAPEGSLADRAALVRLDALPESDRRGFGFGGATRATIRNTSDAARSAGAESVVFVLDPRVTPGEVGALVESAEQPARALGGVTADADPATFFITREAARRLFRMAGLDGTELLERASLERPLTLSGVTLRLAAPLRAHDEETAPNMVGVIRGSDPGLSGTYVVLSAHMDHVGVGRPDETGDSIYNGADDDASGTAVLMEVAEALAALPVPPKRSVLVLAVSGEEKGLLGSRWFSEHPTVPLDSVVANINLDMVSRNAPDTIVVIGREYSSLGATVHEVAGRPELGLTLAADPWPEQRFFFRSDHFNFARHEIPALFFFAGTHEDYHRPSDEVDRIDADKASRVGRLVFLLALAVADDPEPPRWDEDGLEEVRRLVAEDR